MYVCKIIYFMEMLETSIKKNYFKFLQNNMTTDCFVYQHNVKCF